MKLPDFIIPGATKCGTTALWYNLDKHPDISMASKSSTSFEMNFFGGKKTRKKGLDWYKSRFSGGISGEKSTIYCQNVGAMKNIKELIPNVKLILCIRHPVDRAYSNYQMNANTNSNKRLNESFNFSLFGKRYAQGGIYINMIKNVILPNFDKSQLYICPAEIMKRDLTAGMKDIFSFIGVDDLNFPVKKIEYMKGRTRQEDIILNREENYYRVWSKFKEKLDGSMRKQLLDFYKPYNDQLFEYLGYEIKEWAK